MKKAMRVPFNVKGAVADTTRQGDFRIQLEYEEEGEAVFHLSTLLY